MTVKRKEKLEGYKHYCPICGKEFWAFADWQYRKRVPGKKNKIYLCSSKCKQEVEREKEKAKEAAGQT